jgi:hypothetical protein
MYKERTLQLMHFLAASLGGSVSDVKLMALMYFSERKVLASYGTLMTYDEFLSSATGPVLERVEQIMEAYDDDRFTAVFSQPVQSVTPEGVSITQLSLKESVIDLSEENPAFDLMCRADRACIGGALAIMGPLGDDAVIQYVTDPQHCPEWSRPAHNGLRTPITPYAIMGHLGFSDGNIQHYEDEIRARKLNHTHPIWGCA